VLRITHLRLSPSSTTRHHTARYATASSRSKMRTRRQDKIDAGVIEAASAPSESSLPSSPRVLSISQVDAPVVRSLASKTGEKKSKIPSLIQFPLVIILSLAVSSLGYSATYPFTKAAIAVHARSLDTWGEYAALMGWRT
jgi:hypothetical protein